jgi:lipopolysaccharide export system protein LptA
MKRPLLAAALCLCSAIGYAGTVEPLSTLPTTITSQNLDMQSTDTESIFVFTGLVVVRANNMLLTCDRLEAITHRGQKDIARDKEKSSLGQVGKFKNMLATGRVRIEQGDRVATCGRAEVRPGESRITLTEDPMVRDGESTVVGETITLFRDQRRAVVDKPRISLPPLPNLGFPKEAPAPAKSSPTPAPTPASTTPPSPAPVSSKS